MGIVRSETERIFADMIHTYHHYISSRLNLLGLFRGQHPIMMMLAENGEMSQKELAKILHLSPATVTVTLKRMQKANLITRRIDGADQRVQRVSLTEMGEKLNVDACKVFSDVVENVVFTDFTKEEREMMLGYLQRITQNLINNQGEGDGLHAHQKSRILN